MRYVKWFWCCLLLLPLSVVAQKKYIAHYFFADSVRPDVALTTGFSGRAAAEKYVVTLPSILLAKGFLAAAIDSARYDSLQCRVWLYTGNKYEWQHLNFDSNAQRWLQDAGWSASWTQTFLKNNSPDSLQSMLLNELANNGHPFASVGWDSVSIINGKISARLILNEGPAYKIDSISQQGKAKLKAAFLYRYLDMKKGMPFSQQKVDAVDARLEQLSFVEAQRTAQLQMLGTGSVMNVYLQPRRSNTLNLLIGVMPASTQTPDSKLQVTGDANILLRNAFAGGETIGVNWQQLQYKSPRLNLLFQQPYLFASNAGLDFQFDLFKKDTQYLNLQLKVGVPYQFSTTKSGKLFYQFQQNNVATTDTAYVKATQQLPDLADFSLSMLGLEYEWNTADHRNNPRKGLQAMLTGLAGLKNIRKSNDIVNLKDPANPGYNYGSLYDTVKLNTYQVKLHATIAKYFPLAKQSAFKLAMNAGLLQSANYYRNELFQIGGSRLLRGFDEESIYARSYLTGTAEFRYLTGRNGFFFAFLDGGTAAYKDQLQEYTHNYLGSGLGLTFETKNSQVSLTWAVGKRDDLPLNMRQSKIHIGFVNFF